MIRVVAAVIEREGRFLIAKRRPGGALGGRWEFPGGKIEPGETPEESLRRELREEFQVETEIGSFLGSEVHKYPTFTIDLMAYRAVCVSGEFKLADHAEIQWALPGELDRYDFAEADHFIVRMLLGAPASLPASES